MAPSQRPDTTLYDAPPSDDESLRGSLDSVSRDHDILEDEDERQRDALLAGGVKGDTGRSEGGKRGVLGRLRGSRNVGVDGQGEGLLRKEISGGKSSEGKEAMYEMEEGGPLSPIAYSDDSSGIDREKMEAALEHKRTSKGRRICGITALHAVIAALFVAIAYGAYLATMGTRLPPQSVVMTSNGTSLFGATTLLISLDGFRADFLQRNLTPALHSLVQEGTSPKYMTPSFPSLTFPNHYTLVTGLHPESHGIVANTFYDKEFAEGFAYQTPEHSMQPKWWAPNPIWETAEHQGVRTAIHMWPGSEAHIGDIEPTHIDKYNGTELLSRKVDRIFELLDKPGLHDDGASGTDPRPQFIAAYVPNVDKAGHKYGPNSTEMTDSIEEVDAMMKSIVAGIAARNLTSIVNVVVVSDHGMASTSNERLIQLEDLVDPDLFSSIDGWPHYGLRPKNLKDLKAIHIQLQEHAQRSEGFDVYLRDEDMPERYHFTNNERIAPLWLIPRTGWLIVTKDEYDVKEGQKSNKEIAPLGAHGYDNEDPLMRAIFIARGPAFPHPAGSRLAPFQNTEVYNILCDSLHMKPAANNGTLRLPLKPVGIHGDDEAVQHAVPIHSINSTATTKTPNNSTVAMHKPSIGVDEPAPDPGSRPVVDDSSHRKATAKERLHAFVEALRNKWKGFTMWINGHKVAEGQKQYGEGKGASSHEGEKSADGKSSADEKEGAVKDGHTNWAVGHTSSGGNATGPISAGAESEKNEEGVDGEHASNDDDIKSEHDDEEWHYTGPVSAQNKDYKPPPPGEEHSGHTSFAGADDTELDPGKGPVSAQRPDYKPEVLT